MATKKLSYKASPTGARFHASDKVIRGFRGPVGSGKTVACIQEIHRLAKDQWPNNQGIRKTRWALIRNTSLELRTTTLNTFRQWIPEEICQITMSPMITGKLKYDLQDGTKVEAEFIFLALDQPKDTRKLLSLEVTGVFINEAREISFSVIKAARERIGRYPSQVDGYRSQGDYIAPEEPCKRKAILMDTNPCDDTHWWYQLAENGHLDEVSEERKDKAIAETARIFDFFSSPPPLLKDRDGDYVQNPKAENIAYLPGGYQYYFDMLAGNSEDHINVMILGNYGTIKDGKPVYPEYNDSVHCREVKPIPSLPIALGWDFGLTPSVVIGQLTSLGQLRVIDELVGENTSVRAFARDIVKPHLSKKYKGYTVEFSVGDPSGNNRGEGEGKAAIGILNDDYTDHDGDTITPLNLWFKTVPAPTNDITRRLDAVKLFLTKMVDAGEPGYLLNKSCRYLRKGKQGSYRYKRLQVSGQDRFQEKPDKNDYSHPADAEQYLALGFIEGYGVDDGDDYDEYDNDIGRSAVGGY